MLIAKRAKYHDSRLTTMNSDASKQTQSFSCNNEPSVLRSPMLTQHHTVCYHETATPHSAFNGINNTLFVTIRINSCIKLLTPLWHSYASVCLSARAVISECLDLQTSFLVCIPIVRIYIIKVSILSVCDLTICLAFV